eukprot:TRINITY_DN1907_c0_g1_i1.p1 TRINITY_DN1907_c0_g1~~TRINITY_DN1907_c0_g1_i1.p1  ORF type:complete len:179 (+),score=55.87 TRINITY_DN1907_c0_g1_i1:40-576(+)
MFSPFGAEPLQNHGIVEDDDESELVFASDAGSPEDEMFDNVIGKLEELIMDEEFQQKQNKFFAANCHHFSDWEENKLIYSDIHKQYVTEIEAYIEHVLRRGLPAFDMPQFVALLRSREDEVTGDIWDLLISFTDFVTFKELMLAFKRQAKAALALHDVQKGDTELSVEGKSPKKPAHS